MMRRLQRFVLVAGCFLIGAAGPAVLGDTLGGPWMVVWAIITFWVYRLTRPERHKQP